MFNRKRRRVRIRVFSRKGKRVRIKVVNRKERRVILRLRSRIGSRMSQRKRIRRRVLVKYSNKNHSNLRKRRVKCRVRVISNSLIRNIKENRVFRIKS